jgi:L-amino acid N-acyltransferase YncA
MNLIIREVKTSDAEGIINIFNPIIEAGIYTAITNTITIEAEREFILNFNKRGIFHVAVDNSKQEIVGFQNLEPFSNYTNAFDHVGIIGTFVSLSHRRQGIAKNLFSATFDSCRILGYEKIFAYVRADNKAALATYLNQGFSIIGTARKHAKINGFYIDEIMIERFL